MSYLQSRLTEDAIRAIINEEVSAASRQVLEQQKALLEESAASPTTIAPAQWNQLGKRLINIDQQLGELKEAAQGSGEGALASEGDGALQQELEDLRSLFVQLSGAVKSALEQQQSMQSAVLTQASAQAAALTAVQASIEGALTQLCDELLAAVRSAAQSEAPSSTATPAWAEEMEMKITGALDPVMQALASTRTQTLEPQSTEAQGGLDLTNVSVKLDSLAGQLTELQRRVDQREASTTAQAVAAEGLAEAAAVIGPPDGLVEVDNTVTAATAGLDAKHDAYERMQSILQEESTAELEESADTAAVMGPPVEERIDEAAPMNAAAGGKNDAYERMQAMLREDSAIDADAAVSEGDLPETDFEFQNPEEQGGSAGPATGGVPISEWLSVDEPEASMEGGAAAMQLEDEEQDVVPIGETATSQGTSTSNAAGPRTEMVFNTFGGGGVEDPSLGQTPPTEQPSPQGGGSIPDSRADSEPSTPSNGASAPTSAVPNSTDTDAEELYTLGLENMRQGRALCAEPGGGGLTEGDALLADAYQCFQKTLAIDPGNIKALGNSGNALMARGRAALAMAEDAAARGQPEAAERLTQQAEQLLVKAGRLYREVLEGDASQARAFLNWGRVICLRAETARDRGNATGAHDLFCNAAEKFEAALELGMNGEQRAEGLRLAGSALMSGALCLGPEQGQARRELLGEAAEYLEAVVAGGQGPEVDEAWDKLQLCREYLSSR